MRVGLLRDLALTPGLRSRFFAAQVGQLPPDKAYAGQQQQQDFYPFGGADFGHVPGRRVQLRSWP